MSAGHLIACHECDLLHRVTRVPPGSVARCCRCGSVLSRPKRDSLERTLALTITGLILFAVSNVFPFLSFKLQGLVQQTLLVSGIRQLHDQGLTGLAVLVAFTTIIAPAFQLVGLLYILLPLRFNRISPGLFQVFRLFRSIQPWGMMEVFMLGILVSIVKLAKMAHIVPGVAAFSFMALIFVLAAALASLDPHEVWDRWEGSRR